MLYVSLMCKLPMCTKYMSITVTAKGFSSLFTKGTGSKQSVNSCPWQWVLA